MRYIQSILLFILSGSVMFSQELNSVRLGQRFQNGETTCLVIKSEPKTLLKLSTLENYKSVKAVRLINFDDTAISLDTLFSLFSKHLNPQVITFENCALATVNAPLPAFSELKEVRILKNSMLYDNSLFVLLKNSPIEKFIIQQEEEDFAIDSLHLLPSLREIKISNTSKFQSLNKTESYQFISQGNLNQLSMKYYENLFKPIKNKKLIPQLEKRDTVIVLAVNPMKSEPLRRPVIHPKPYSCIHQPITDIDIHDTVFFFQSQNENEFYYESGSKVMIDRDAFLTANGEAYRGEVDFFYREFRSPVEIMLSGIPMNTTVNGEEKVFKSGGMYEARAYDTKGNPLKLKTDTSIKINFALTDTSSEFKFYTLQDNGNWDVKSESVNTGVITGRQTLSRITISKAILEYYQVKKRLIYYQDSTDFHNRFENPDYAFIYKKDRMSANRFYTDKEMRWLNSRGFFRVKYLKQTKDKELIFTVYIPAKAKDADCPRYIRALEGKKFMFTGNLTKEEFKSKFNRSLYFWDLRASLAGGEIIFDLKTRSAERLELSCVEVTTDKNGKLKGSKKMSQRLVADVNHAVYVESKRFNRKLRKGDLLYNTVNYKEKQREQIAFSEIADIKTAAEKTMSLERWISYADSSYNRAFPNSFEATNDLAKALVKSDLGIHNIDAYIHSGEMQQIFVNYEGIDLDSVSSQYNVVLYKSINTSYYINKNASSLAGYYLKNAPNYIIRFSNDGFMQVTRPEELLSMKAGNKINLAYKPQHSTKGLNSDQITDLIMKN